MDTTDTDPNIAFDDLIYAIQHSIEKCNQLYAALTEANNELPIKYDRIRDCEHQLQAPISSMGLSAAQRQELSNHMLVCQQEVEHFMSVVTGCTNDLLNEAEQVAEMCLRATSILVQSRLVEWLMRQKVATTGPKDDVKYLLDELDELDNRFEQCGVQLVSLLNCVTWFAEVLRNQHGALADDMISRVSSLHAQLHSLCLQFIWNSIIISMQPPAVLVKSREADNTRSTRFPCTIEVRMLGGYALGCRSNTGLLVHCLLVNETEAMRIRDQDGGDGKGKLVEDDQFQLSYRTANWTLQLPTVAGKPPIYSAKFDKVRLIERASWRASQGDGPSRRRNVCDLRYYMAFQIDFAGAYNLDGNGYKLSLPMAALVHTNSKVDAAMFWDRAFAAGTGVLSQVPSEIPWDTLRPLLNRKFIALLHEADTTAPLPIPLNELALDHLGELLTRSSNGVVFRADFLDKTIEVNGEKTNCTFQEWFYKNASIVAKKMLKQYNAGLVQCFCDQGTAEHLVRQSGRPSLMIRFSDTAAGFIKITCYLPNFDSNENVWHLRTDGEALNTSIGEAIHGNPTKELNMVELVYPNRPKAELWLCEEDDSRPPSRRAPRQPLLLPTYDRCTVHLDNKPVGINSTG